MKPVLKSVAIFLLLSAGLISFAAAAPYSVKILPGGEGFASSINNAGVIVGNALAGHGATLWDPETGLHSLGASGDAYDINDLGQVTGNFSNNLGQSHAFLWDPVNGVQDLGVLPGYLYSTAYGINNFGQVAGWSIDYFSEATLWDPINGIQGLGDLPGGLDDSLAYDINNAGQVVGRSLVADDRSHAFLWNPVGGMLDLGTLPGDFNSESSGINDLGQVVGWSYSASFGQPFIWDSINGMQPLGVPDGWSLGVPWRINNSGVVTGNGLFHGEDLAFVWDSANGTRDLNNLINSHTYTLRSALGINDVGQIVGVASKEINGMDHYYPFLLSPSDLPTSDSFKFLTLGAVILLSLRQRKRWSRRGNVRFAA